MCYHGFHLYFSLSIYAVKAQTSLAPLSRFCGSRITTAHAHHCCRFQSYAKTVPSRMKLTTKLTKREPHSWDLCQRTTWPRRVTSDFNSVLMMMLEIFLTGSIENACFYNMTLSGVGRIFQRGRRGGEIFENFWKFVYQNGIIWHMKCNCRVGVGQVLCIGLDQCLTCFTVRSMGGGGGGGMAPLCPPSYANDDTVCNG